MKDVLVYRLKLIKEDNVEFNVDTPLSKPEVVVEYANEIFDIQNLAEEHFVIFTLNTKNFITGAFVVSMGTLNSSLVHPREVFKRALLCNAAAIICVHNHPSGDPEPSQKDIRVTRLLEEAGTIMGVKVLDHIIIGNRSKYVSLKQKGII
jgi:DNA repair protein RadC